MHQLEASITHVETAVRGRVLIAPPEKEKPRNFLIGFHGYAENAGDQMQRLLRMVPAEDWLLCSPQALHPFYTRSDGQVVASWMTRLDRELAVADNVSYVKRTFKRVVQEYGEPEKLVLCGFSQGAGMAYRAAAGLDLDCWILAVGGDIPPDVGDDAISRFRGVFLCRGERDRQYPESRLEEDLRRFQGSGVPTRVEIYPGGHQWNEAVDRAALEYMKELG
jgi:predicted esterase